MLPNDRLKVSWTFNSDTFWISETGSTQIEKVSLFYSIGEDATRKRAGVRVVHGELGVAEEAELVRRLVEDVRH